MTGVATWLLIHSPLVGAATWKPVAAELRRRGEEAIVPDLAPALAGDGDHAARQADLVTVAVKRGPICLGRALHCTKQADTPQPGPDTARRVATRGRIPRGLPDRPSCGSPRAHRRRPGRRRGSAHDRTSWPYAQVVDDDVLVIETSWPATTIDGDPGIVSGMLSVSRTVGGEFLLNLSVGPPGGQGEAQSRFGWS